MKADLDARRRERARPAAALQAHKRRDALADEEARIAAELAGSREHRRPCAASSRPRPRLTASARAARRTTWPARRARRAAPRAARERSA